MEGRRDDERTGLVSPQTQTRDGSTEEVAGDDAYKLAEQLRPAVDDALTPGPR
jgi:hypothetical protein